MLRPEFQSPADPDTEVLAACSRANGDFALVRLVRSLERRNQITPAAASELIEVAARIDGGILDLAYDALPKLIRSRERAVVNRAMPSVC